MFDQRTIEAQARITARICGVYEQIEEADATSHFLRAAVREGLVWYHTILSVRPEEGSYEWARNTEEAVQEIVEQAHAEVARYGAITQEELLGYVKQAKLAPFDDATQRTLAEEAEQAARDAAFRAEQAAAEAAYVPTFAECADHAYALGLDDREYDFGDGDY